MGIYDRATRRRSSAGLPGTVRLARFAPTWEFGGDVSWVEVSMDDDSGEPVRLTLTHTTSLTEHWGRFGAGALGLGWELGLLGPTTHLEQP